MEYKKNDVVTVTIEDIGNDGEGIGKAEGYTLFVKDAVIGDVVTCKIMKAKKNYAYARLEKVVTPSSFRVEPRCPIHRQCGGCQIQAMEYEAQLAYKHKKIRNHLVRIGGFAEEEAARVMEPMVGMEEPFRYRNKAQYPIGTSKENRPIAGFYAGRTHDIVENTDCLLGVCGNKAILEAVLAYMERYGVSVYDEKIGTGLIRHVLIRTGFDSGEVMVCLVINKRKKAENGGYLPNQEQLLEGLCGIEGMTSISVSFHTENTNVIMGQETVTIWGQERIRDTLHRLDPTDFSKTGEKIVFEISPLSFYQVNPVQTEKLYSLAMEYAGLTGREVVWDLYCGIGTISLFLSSKARKVYGVEIVPQAIADARANAKNNGIGNVEFFVGRAEEVLPAKYKEEGISADVIVVDPPRKGCDAACLETMIRMQPDRIVYVSCDSATLARDLRVLCDGGYELKRVRGVDQFGGTVHVETCVLLTLKGFDNKNLHPTYNIELELPVSN